MQPHRPLPGRVAAVGDEGDVAAAVAAAAALQLLEVGQGRAHQRQRGRGEIVAPAFQRRWDHAGGELRALEGAGVPVAFAVGLEAPPQAPLQALGRRPLRAAQRRGAVPVQRQLAVDQHRDLVGEVGGRIRRRHGGNQEFPAPALP